MDRPVPNPVLDPGGLALSVLVSWALVAFTIEADNEFEHRARQRTTQGGGKGPWLISTLMWADCLRHVPDEGIEAGALEAAARTPTPLGGMRRWGWVTVDPPPRNRGTQGLRRDARVALTRAGGLARDGWPMILGLVDGRWRERAGDGCMDRILGALGELDARLDPMLPDCLPIVGAGDLRMSNGLRWARAPGTGAGPAAAPWAGSPGVDLYTRLSRVLLGFAREVEEASAVGMALGHNVLRVLCDAPDGVEVRSVPQLCGVAKEWTEVSLGVLARRGMATVSAARGGRRLRLARPSASGLRAMRSFAECVGAVEARWAAGPAGPAVAALRAGLAALAAGGDSSALWRAIEPYPDGWRASEPPRRTLPWFPMTTHRGGYPDGS